MFDEHNCLLHIADLYKAVKLVFSMGNCDYEEAENFKNILH